ncbi:hypothetical protein [Pseudomonas japonica]|uniref:Uncharacterized protein n=1 Tax=Pseudomonas japonica TaxID=256466 RepID=A0A239BSF2_9PSED|nr:hypothetical protein [Pseudomonas japonica]SNS10806.1 hypothetical protein SAMN05444352_103169 [Pseudomonas japonica]
MAWYRANSVSATNGSVTITGANTNFSANARVGDAFLGPDGRWYEVTNIASATVLSILPAYLGATTSGGSYAIAPVQGYTKTLADKFSDIANQWGSTLAGLGSVSTENVVPIAKGGTGGTSQASARTGLGLKTAATADIVGTVSMNSGVPAGAVFERGSNANGDYVKFADGSMICFLNISVTDQAINSQYTAGVYQGTRAWFYPVSFAVPPTVTPGAFTWAGAANWSGLASVPSTVSVLLRGFDAVARAAGTPVQISAVAVGRWAA